MTFYESPLSYGTGDVRERDVRGLLHVIEEFGSATERFFERLYRGLSRKQKHTGGTGEPDQMSALRQANRELAARVRDAQTVAARLQAVFASIEEGVIMQDTEGRVVLINKAAYQLLGTIKAFWDSDLGRLFESARNHPPTDSEMEPIGAPIRVQVNDRILGAQLAAVATPEGAPLGTLIVLRDVTREALADRIKEDFVTQITHELRTPLTAIKGMSEVLLGQPDDRPPNRKFLEAIGRNAAILDRMIVELLDISEISAGSFAVRKQELALDELALDVVKGQEARIKKNNLNVGVMVVNRAHVTIVGDDRRLRWALGHLLDNSINYTLKGGFITIRIGAVKGERVLLEVIDSGVGISDRDLPHVFERFYRGEAKAPNGKTLDPRGLGQGLYVARAVAEAHGGYLAVSSTVGQGSKFTLAIPFAAQPEPTTEVH
ncbi:MAG: PAS domain-containing protein [Anaerolineae bacterium]|nr:PAS domain-containing protein [Anaerolineae bacterium]